MNKDNLQQNLELAARQSGKNKLVQRTFEDNLPQNFRSKYFCRHKFSNYTYYGNNHPMCDLCGYEDRSRLASE